MKSIICLITLAMLNGCNTPAAQEEKPRQETNAAVETKSASQPPVVSGANTAFDVPLLLSENIDQIGRLLSNPAEEDAPNLTTNELERRYNQKGYKMIITYNTETRKVEGIMLVADSGKTKNCTKLLEAGNLQLNNPHYSVDSLASEKEGYYESIAVTSN